MSSRRQKLENQLMMLEARFEASLVAALRRCEQGHWGMFGRNESVLEAHSASLAARLTSKDGTELLELVESIDSLRSRLGYTEPNALCARFLDFRKKRGSNDLGEPKLAAEFLARIEARDEKSDKLRVDNSIEV